MARTKNANRPRDQAKIAAARAANMKKYGRPFVSIAMRMKPTSYEFSEVEIVPAIRATHSDVEEGEIVPDVRVTPSDVEEDEIIFVAEVPAGRVTRSKARRDNRA